MAEVDLAALEKQVTEIQRNTVSARSRAVYENSYGRFVAWVVAHKPHLVPHAFAEKLGDVSSLSVKQLRKRLKPLLDRNPLTPPLLFDDLQTTVFGAWLLTLEKPDGGRLSYAALNTHRAGFFNLYRDYGREMPPTMEKELREYFKGLKRKMATSAAQGEIRAKTGKDPLSFELFCFLCEKLLHNPSKDMGFARTYMIIAWNLMCRSANAFGVCHGHMEWSGDAMCIYFAHQKNDQEGNRPRDPRHIYANPLRPAICPVLALAIFWTTSSFDSSDKLFPGSNQYERFRKCLRRLFEIEDVAHELRRRGVNRDELGTHSMRKGAATYCASGSTACPSSTAVHLRAGWSLGGVQNTYLRYEAAGDMHVGRTVSGLPPASHEFAVLPPHFGERDALVDSAISCTFPGLPDHLKFVGEFCLASLVYHSPYLRSHLSSKHPLLESTLFQHPSLISDLVPKLCSTEDDCKRVRATGVPPHVAILGKMKTLLDTALKTIQHIDESRAATVKGIMDELEKRAIGAGVVTFDGLDAALMQCLRCAGLTDLAEKVNNRAESADTQRDDSQLPTTPSFLWGGRFRRVPHDFELPDCSVPALWVSWMCGNASKKIPPLRMLDGRDMPSRNLQKRLSDVRFIMTSIESEAKRTGAWRAKPSVEDAVKIFTDCSSCIEIPAITATRRKRRQGQLSWTTVVALRRRTRRLQNHDWRLVHQSLLYSPSLAKIDTFACPVNVL